MAPRAAIRSPGDGRRLPDPKLLCRPRQSRGAVGHRCRSPSPPAEGHAHPMSGSDRHAVSADMVFDGASVHPQCAVVIEGARVAALLPRSEVPSDVPTDVLPAGTWLAPGFIDVQVNGGGDVLFNDTP